jgi:hypothetical protein
MNHHLRGDHATRRVWLDGRELLPAASQRVYNHSPDGFCWGYGGSGPAQLALAICLELTRSQRVALALYQQFKREVIAGLPDDFDIDFDFGAHYQEIVVSKTPAIEPEAANPATESRAKRVPGKNIMVSFGGVEGPG